MSFVQIITWLYGASGVAIIASYAPQIRAAWKSQQGAEDVSLATWAFWCLTSVVSLLYASAVVKDSGFVLMASGNVAGCFAVTGVAGWRRAQFRRRREGAAQPVPAGSVAGL